MNFVLENTAVGIALALADLLALLSLGVKGMCLGPSLPAFLSPNVLQFLIYNFDIKPIITPDDDLKQILG